MLGTNVFRDFDDRVMFIPVELSGADHREYRLEHSCDFVIADCVIRPVVINKLKVGRTGSVSSFIFYVYYVHYALYPSESSLNNFVTHYRFFREYMNNL